MVIDTRVIAKKLSLPRFAPYVGIAKFAACIVGFMYAGDMLAGVTHNYLAIFILGAIFGYAAWKIKLFFDGGGANSYDD